jgi:hypothetical protein
MVGGTKIPGWSASDSRHGRSSVEGGGRVLFRYGNYEITPPPQLTPVPKVPTPIHHRTVIPDQAA